MFGVWLMKRLCVRVRLADLVVRLIVLWVVLSRFGSRISLVLRLALVGWRFGSVCVGRVRLWC